MKPGLPILWIIPCLGMGLPIWLEAKEEKPKKAFAITETDRRHWAFQPIEDAVSPPKEGHAIGLGPVDQFIAAKLNAAGLSFSPPAGRRELIRRITFDLTGLPPSPDEVQAFVNDDSPDAYPRLVERLLASPHHGEHWARHWLDVARYSDTKGYVYAREERRYVHASHYRDWVVRALNDDMPYDRFLLLQIAADQVEPAHSPHLAAMGLLTLGRRFLGVTHDIIDDRIDVVTRGALGLTVSCARCHDHKLDPIPTRDYYALYGVFKNSHEKLVRCEDSEVDAAYARELAAREKKLRDTLTLRREETSARARAKVREHLLAQFELDLYPEENFGQLLDADSLNPVVVRLWQQYLERARAVQDPVFSAWHAFQNLRANDFTQRGAAVLAEFRKGKVNRRVLEAFATPPASIREVADRYGALFADVEKQWKAALAANPKAHALPDADAEALRQVLYGPGSPFLVPDEHIANIEMYFTSQNVVELWKLQGEVDRWLLEPRAPKYATVLEDRPEPVAVRVFERGNPLTKGEEVTRHFLEILSAGKPAAFAQGSGRLEMARAIVHADNPLTARVMVNRVWMHHFGQGLVNTPSDFGRKGGRPSHPELLDWLARRFMTSGWSLKTLHRDIVLTRAYQQSSQGPADAAARSMAQEKDPENKLLWRANTHRLSIEEARDTWLTAAGHLDRHMGGRPAKLFGTKNTRRTLYATVDREQLPPVLAVFDFANPDLSIPKRTETTVPQQALFGLNHPFLADEARVMWQRQDIQRSRGDADRIRHIYQLLLQRQPTALEMQDALVFVREAARPENPKESETARDWQYGYGEWDERAGVIKTFTRLPLFNGKAWQGGEHFPDVTLGWLQLTASGGHPGNSRKHAVVRRWTAPRDGIYDITSRLMHEPDAGDGIRAFIGHSTQGQLRAATVRKSEADMSITSQPMKTGESLDFVVDIGNGLNSDQFLWAPRITLAGGTGSGGELDPLQWDAEKDFSKMTASSLNPWEQLIQVLMLSNEFLFVD